MEREILRTNARGDAPGERSGGAVKFIAACLAVMAAAAGGLWAGQTGLIKLPTTLRDALPTQAHHAETPVQAAAAPGTTEPQRRIIHYRNPMGLPDVSPVPKKDSMGMDYIPFYEGDEGGDTVKVSPGKIQRTGVQTEPVAKRALSRTIHAPGIVAVDERLITVVAPRFDGFIDKVGPVTSGTHVKKGR